MSRSTKRRVWRVVSPGTRDRSGQRLETVALVLASLNVVAVVLQSVDSLYNEFRTLFDGFAFVSVSLFTVLFVVQLWASGTRSEYGGSTGRLRFIKRPFVLLDFGVIVVFWATYLADPQTQGWVRILWFARVFNLPRFRRSKVRFKRVISAQRGDLAIAFSGAAMLVLVSSTLMFFVENRAQPEAFGSIPAALWWGIVTLTTVGYGDVVPVTPLGKLLGGITTIGGIAFFALPSSILAAGFFAERQSEGKASTATEEAGTDPPKTPDGEPPRRCPHCGESLDTTGSEQQ